MAESIVTDWITDYTVLIEQSEIRTFAAQHEHNHEIASALFTIINERLKYPDVSVFFFFFCCGKLRSEIYVVFVYFMVWNISVVHETKIETKLVFSSFIFDK